MGTVALDFDGTIRDDGKDAPNTALRSLMWQLHSNKHQIIVWTGNVNLDAIAEWMTYHQVPYDGLNRYPSEPYKFSVGLRKIVADCYIDDRAVNPQDGIAKVVSFLAKHGIK